MGVAALLLAVWCCVLRVGGIGRVGPSFQLTRLLPQVHAQHNGLHFDGLNIAQLLASARIDDVLRPGFSNHFVRQERSSVVSPSFEVPQLQLDIPFNGVPPGWDLLPRNGAEFVAQTMQRFQSGVSGSAAPQEGKSKPQGQGANSGGGVGKKSVAKLPKGLVAVPSEVMFGDRATCVCHMELLTLVNTGGSVVEVASVAMDSMHYHHSFVVGPGKTVSIAPGKNLTIQIVFLPAVVGEQSRSWMTVQSSGGGFQVRMLGRGVANQYGAESFQGVRVPPSVLFSPPIALTNPHDEVLRVLEVFTTGNFLQLALPEGKEGDPQHKPWDLLPHQTKTILHLAFVSNTPGRFHGFITLRTSKGTLFLRVDLMVAMGGVYVTTQNLEFHTLTNPRQRKRLRIKVINSSPLPVALQSMRAENTEPLLRCDFRAGQLLLPGQEQAAGEVEFRGTKEGVYSGRIVLETNSQVDPVVYVPYTARVMHGSLKFSVANTTFFTPGASVELQNAVKALDKGLSSVPELIITQTQELTNSFRVPITLYSATVDDSRFSVLQFEPGVTIAPNATYSGLVLQYRGLPDPTIARLRLSMQSNVAKEFAVPIWTFHGRLAVARVDGRSWTRFAAGYSDSGTRGIVTKESMVCEGNCVVPKYHSTSPATHELTSLFAMLAADSKLQDAETGVDDIVTLTEKGGQSVLDFGALTVNEERRVRINITNLNPRDVKLHRFTSDIPSLRVKFEFIHFPQSKQIILLDNADQGLWIRQYHSAIFTLTISAATEQRTSGRLTMETWFQTREFLVSYETMAGSLEVFPKSVNFGFGFPGAVRRLPLYALSTYRKPVSVIAVQSSDERFVGVVYNNSLTSDVNTTFAVVLFDAGRLDQHNSAKSGSTASQAIQQFNMHNHKKWSKDLQYIPLTALRQLAAFGITKKDVDQHNQNEFLWGRLRATGQDVVNATLTVVTNVVPVYDVPVTARLRQPSLGVVREVEFPVTQYGETSERFVTITNPSESPVVLDSVAFYTVFDGGGGDDAGADDEGAPTVPTADDCSFHLGGEGKVKKPVTIAGGGNVRFGPIAFRPRKRTGTHGAVMLLKNNLTLIHTISLSGEGGTPVVRFLDSRNFPIPYGVTLNASVEPSLYRAHVSNVGPPIRASSGVVDSEGRGGAVIFALSGPRVVAQCTAERQEPIRMVTHVLMKNVGTLPLWIRETLVGNVACESRGFAVDPCLRGTWLTASESINLTISYVPDFSSSRLSRPLIFATSVGLVSLPLEASVSAETLSVCHFASPEVSPSLSFWFAFLRLIALGLFAALVFFVARELMRAVPSSSPMLSARDAQVLEQLKLGSRDSGSSVVVPKVSAATEDESEEPRQQDTPPTPKLEQQEEPVEEPHSVVPVPVQPIAPVPKNESTIAAAMQMSRSSSSELSPPLSRNSDPIPSVAPTTTTTTSRNKKSRTNARNAAAAAAAAAASTSPSSAPAIVKETVTIPPKLARVNSNPPPEKPSLRRDSSDSRESEESSDEAEKSYFSFRFEGAMDGFDVTRFATRVAELTRVDQRRVHVSLLQSGGGTFIAECALGVSGEKNTAKMRQLLKSSRSQLSGQLGHAVMDYALGRASALRPVSPTKSAKKKEAKKGSAITSATVAPAVRLAGPSPPPPPPARPNVAAPASTARPLSRQTAAATKSAGKSMAVAPTLTLNNSITPQRSVLASPSPPPPAPMVPPASVSVASIVGNKPPKRFFKAVDLFGGQEISTGHSGSGSNSVGASSYVSSVAAAPFVTSAFEDFLSVPPFSATLDSPSPPPSAQQGLLPRDLLSSSGSGYSAPEFPPVLRVRQEPSVPLQSLFGEWAVASETADSLISQLRAPQTGKNGGGSTMLEDDDQEALFSGLAWMGEDSGSAGAGGLLEVALEDDPSLSDVPRGSDLFLFPTE